MSAPYEVTLTLLQLLCLETRDVAPANIVLSQIDSRLRIGGSGRVMKILLMKAGQVESLDFLRHPWED